VAIEIVEYVDLLSPGRYLPASGYLPLAENVTVVNTVLGIAIVVLIIIVCWIGYRWWKRRPAKEAKK
jgi:membrane protein DedA with SNARE-associated domain